MLYAYGMPERPYGPLCQPHGVVEFEDCPVKNLPEGISVWSVIWYKEKLSAADLRDYELIRLPEMDRP